eukprot:scaffold434307_cov46-Prasinocladus_malaysianus.AAC.1
MQEVLGQDMRFDSYFALLIPYTFHQGAEEDIDERLDASVKRILQQNRRMAEELRLHIQETDELQTEMRLVDEARAKLQREVNLKTEIEEQYAKRGAKQAKDIRDSQAKVLHTPCRAFVLISCNGLLFHIISALLRSAVLKTDNEPGEKSVNIDGRLPTGERGPATASPYTNCRS